VADVEVAGSIGKHGKSVVFGTRVVIVDGINAILFPFMLPFLFHFHGVILLCHDDSPFKKKSYI
jgi:hypothetical protein